VLRRARRAQHDLERDRGRHGEHRGHEQQRAQLVFGGEHGAERERQHHAGERAGRAHGDPRRSVARGEVPRGETGDRVEHQRLRDGDDELAGE